MRIFNQILATIISLALIIGSALGIVYIVGFLANVPELTRTVANMFQSLTRLSTGQAQAILLGVFILALILFILEVRPWRALLITLRDDNRGWTRIYRADIERFLAQRLSQERAITPEVVDISVYRNKLSVEAGVAASSTADRQTILSQVENNIKDNLSSIGLDEDVDRIDVKVSWLKRVA